MIEIKQTCDGCGTSRIIKDLQLSPQYNGWRGMDVSHTQTKWLCAACIKLATAGAFMGQVGE